MGLGLTSSTVASNHPLSDGSRAVQVVLNRLCERVVLNRRARFRLIKLILVVKGRGRQRRRRRFAGAERGSRFSQRFLNPCRGRVRATEHASRDLLRVFERSHGLGAFRDRGRYGLLIFFIRVVLFRVAAAVYFLADPLVAAAPVVLLAGGTTISGCAPHASRRVVSRRRHTR